MNGKCQTITPTHAVCPSVPGKVVSYDRKNRSCFHLANACADYGKEYTLEKDGDGAWRCRPPTTDQVACTTTPLTMVRQRMIDLLSVTRINAEKNTCETVRYTLPECRSVQHDYGKGSNEPMTLHVEIRRSYDRQRTLCYGYQEATCKGIYIPAGGKKFADAYPSWNANKREYECRIVTTRSAKGCPRGFITEKSNTSNKCILYVPAKFTQLKDQPRNAKICPDGYTKVGNGRNFHFCEKTIRSFKLSACSTDGTRDSKGDCINSEVPNCQPDATGKCVVKIGSPKCTNGQQLNADGTCPPTVAASGNLVCTSPGFVLSPDKTQCIHKYESCTIKSNCGTAER